MPLRMWTEDDDWGVTCLSCAGEVQKEKLKEAEEEPWDSQHYRSLEEQQRFKKYWYGSMRRVLPSIHAQEICDDGDNLIAFQCPRCKKVWKVVPEEGD